MAEPKTGIAPEPTTPETRETSMLKLSVFQSVTDVAPNLHEFPSWNELLLFLGGHRFDYPHKKAVPLFSPAEFQGNRTNANAKTFHFGVMEFDDTPEDSLLELLQRWTQRGTAFHLYSTWSHPEATQQGKVRVRLLVPFSRPVEAWEWPVVWETLWRDCDCLPDEQDKDAQRCYFFPSAPSGTENLAVSVTRDGDPWNPDSPPLKGEIVPVTPTRKLESINAKHLQALITKTKKSRSPNKVMILSPLENLLAGDSYAEPGERDNITWKLICTILDEFPNAHPQSVANLFVASLQIMEHQHRGAPTVEGVRDKVERKQAEKVIAEVTEGREVQEERKRKIRMTFGFSDRDWPYTNQELQLFAQKLGLPSVEFLRSYWIVQKDNSYYLLVAGVYQGPFTWAELERAAQIYLAPAFTAGVDTHTLDRWGTLQPKGSKELVSEYGTIARAICTDLIAQEATYDPKTGTMTEAPCPFRVTEPKYDPLVAEWLRLLGGETHHKLLDWLAVLTRIDEPCAALYLEGQKGVGKSLLAEGVARLWTERGPIPLADTMKEFNNRATECPVVFADEAIPTDFQGHARTGELRQLIQTRTRTLRRKFLGDATLRGCIRLILAANNADLLSSSEHLTVNDIEAIVDRVVHVDANEATACRKFLEGLPKQVIWSWVNQDVIAKHVLWLRDNHAVDTRHRFLVSGDKSALHRRLTVSSGIRSAVCCWLVSYLLDPRKFDVAGTLLVRVYRGKLYANVRALANQWLLYDTNTKPPAVGEIAKALVGISVADTRQFKDGSGTRTHYREVDTANLISWAEDFGFATREGIEAALSKDTLDKKGGVPDKVVS